MPEIDAAALAAYLVLPTTLAGAVGFLLGVLVKWFADRSLKTYVARLERLDRIDAARVAARSAAYGEIWTLTGAFNLFGPEQRPDLSELSRKLADWYFSRGHVLRTDRDGKQHYFLMQEALMFCQLRGIVPARPSAEVLYAHPAAEDRGSTTVKAVDELFRERIRPTSCGHAPDPDSIELRDLRPLVRAWSAATDSCGTDASLDAWLILQHLFSRFRTRLMSEMNLDEAPEHRRPTPPPGR